MRGVRGHYARRSKSIANTTICDFSFIRSRVAEDRRCSISSRGLGRIDQRWRISRSGDGGSAWFPLEFWIRKQRWSESEI
ncbi:hypothetical protein MRB53_017636 [Persea americana]|uniref:Uncharacterized protein n=1 Tax=Persea americana TaxID=3435 RepID=A0ACC2M5L9_PERAE|nr:hypothetical protein MRB53_017636 [Persea americana]